MKSTAGRLSQSTIAGFLGAAAFALVSAGTAVAVSTTAVTITNPSSGMRAHVTGKGSLVTSERDPYSGTYAKVDAAGRQVVGDGVPAKPWTPSKDFSMDFEGGDAWMPVPTAGRPAIRGCSMRVQVPSGLHPTATLNYTALDDASGAMSHIWVPLVLQRPSSSYDYYVGTFDGDIYPKIGTRLIASVTRSAGAGQSFVSVDCRGEVL